jgi:hypothetical protein
MTNTAKDAQEIRNELKKIGLNTKDVSVRSNIYSMGSSINVTIKSEKALSLRKEIKAIAENHETIDRDHATGEILCGGNRFVFVGVDWKFEHDLMNKHEPAIMEMIEKAKSTMNKIIEYCGMKFFYDDRTDQYCTMGTNGNSYRSIDQFKWVLLRGMYDN